MRQYRIKAPSILPLMFLAGAFLIFLFPAQAASHSGPEGHILRDTDISLANACVAPDLRHLLEAQENMLRISVRSHHVESSRPYREKTVKQESAMRGHIK